MGAFKKASVSLTALALTASAFAGPDLDSRVQELEKKVDMMSTKTVTGTFGPKTALARPEPNGQGWNISLDVLYWHAKVGGTEYAYTNSFRPNGEYPRARGTIEDIDFDWDWGFKVGVGYNFFHDGWDSSLLYTYFKSSGGANSNAKGSSALIPNRGTNNISEGADTYISSQGTLSDAAFNMATKATSNYDFDYDVIDVDLGRNFFVSRSLAIRPFFSLKSLWLDLKQETQFSGGPDFEQDYSDEEAIGLGRDTAHVLDENKVWGLGPRTGLNTKWYLTNGFSFFGNAAATLLYGYFDVTHKNWFSLDTQTHEVFLTDKMHRFVPMGEMKLGLAYDKYIYNDKQHIGVSLGYEVQYMWRVNQTIKPDFPLYSTNGVDANMAYTRFSEDAAVYGVTLEARWDF